MAERELIYRIKFVQDQASATILRGLTKEGLEVEKTL